jgi:chromosome segregation ATPase
MNDDPKDGLAVALSENGPDAPLAALRYAVTWALRSLSEQIGIQDDFAALECVIRLDDALAELRTLLNLVPAIVRIAAPGRPVQERMDDYRNQLEQLYSELSAHRATLHAVGDLESRLAEAQAERDQLQLRLSMLARLEQLTAELPALQVKLAALHEATDAVTASAVENVAQGLVTAVARIGHLTAEQRALVGSELSDLADEAVSAAAALADETRRRDDQKAQVAAWLAEAKRLQDEYEHALPGLELYRQANQDLADGLAAARIPAADSAFERVGGALADIKHQLSALDDLLKPLLDEHARAYAEARKIQTWTG